MTVTPLVERMLLLPLIIEAPEGVPVARKMGVKSYKKRTNQHNLVKHSNCVYCDNGELFSPIAVI